MRALDAMSKAPRVKTLAKAILTWTMCSVRPLSISELQYALKLDIKDTVDALERAIPSICSQLVFVDNHGWVRMIHQTARDFLLQDDLNSESAIKNLEGHNRLAIICLQYLNSEEMKSPRTRRPSHGLLRSHGRSCFVNYASIAFSQHISQASSEVDSLLLLLDAFLKTNVLA